MTPATTGGTLEAESVDVGLHGPDNVQDKYTSKYLDSELGPQFSFGHGSGYASFVHGAPLISHQEVTERELVAGEQVVIAVDVTNTSPRPGDEVVQLYVQDVVATVAPPVRRLVAVNRITVEPGETVVVEFSVGRDQLGFWATDPAGATFLLEPGRFLFYVGGSLERTQAVEMRVL